MLKSKKKTTVKLFKQALVLKSEPKEIIKVEHFLEKINNKLNLDEMRFNKLLVAATEAVNNGIIHGNKRDPRKKVKLTCTLKNSILTITVKDQGKGINPDTIPDPLSQENILRENGRGIFLMKSLMEKIVFKKSKTGSSVIMTMKI
ncbi:MAG: ATP-binding protein [Ignavibacteriales bacterium]|nr:ATP-binding protein [Ignavibacteriales bacterium]